MGLWLPRRLCVPELWGTWDKKPMGMGLRVGNHSGLLFLLEVSGILTQVCLPCIGKEEDRDERPCGRYGLESAGMWGQPKPFWATVLECVPRNQVDRRQGNADRRGSLEARWPLPCLGVGSVLPPSSARPCC